MQHSNGTFHGHGTDDIYQCHIVPGFGVGIQPTGSSRYGQVGAVSSS